MGVLGGAYLRCLQAIGRRLDEWLENTFVQPARRDVVGRTAMVTGNTWTDRYLDAGRFDLLDEVWKYAWDDDLGTVPADAVTHRAVRVARDHDPGRLVVHYRASRESLAATPDATTA